MLPIATSGLVAGVVAHHGIFIRGEWHMKIPQVIASHLILMGVLLYALYDHYSSLKIAASALGTMISCYFSSLFISMTIYRLFFHATSHFPGPKLAAVSKLWHVFHILDSKNYAFLQKLHMEYGQFVRTGPNEITIFHPAAIQEIETSKNQTTKDVWYDLLKPHKSAVFARDDDLHKEWRRSWTQSFSKKCIDAYRPRMVELTQTLSQSISEYEGAPVDIDEVMTWFSFDAMGDALFGEDFGLTRSKSIHPGIVHRDRALSILGPLEGAIWIARLGFSLTPFLGRVKDWFKLVSFCDEQLRKRIQRPTESLKLDMVSFFLEEYNKNSETMNDTDRGLLLSGTVLSAVVAGRFVLFSYHKPRHKPQVGKLTLHSDTTRAVLIAAFWFLSKYPIHADKIRSEIQVLNPNDIDTLLTLPHLNGVINEVLRLAPSAMTGMARITGPNGFVFDGTFIPPFTRITAPKYVIMRMEASFVFPNEFIPERWYSKPELIRDERAFAPFGFGNRMCTGKSFAQTELCLAISNLLRRYKVSFAPEYDPQTMWRDMKDQVTAQPGRVLCIFEPLSDIRD
ncbi:Tryprostatin B 6-hydroxylase [Daldinia childiae]|uniref:Tryprostatin B 6-hydroxylase n=1 Tax=Daldinia childiae TaxID=326645 RepID=UPI00144554BA|nr:Tryprostatin B 6-hydroxylase [Daldinia childiae]KAF3063694.1 Tryprostatin B 6-hydroxylase [Daldinia childiae]